jgi:redox-sensitive bicupin YhaK (pirin superfamily)
MKKILGIYGSPRPHWVGDGFPVRSLFSHHVQGQHISPFLLADYAGPEHFAPTIAPRGVGVHPHRGFETVTIVYQGELEHRDSTGNSGHIGPGDVQWMTAGAGILHEEFHAHDFTRAGGTLEMVQLWVNLPAKDKMTAPRYQTLLRKDIPSVSLPDEAGSLRVIAGAFQGKVGPAQTFTRMNVWDVRLRQGANSSLPMPEGHTLSVVVLRGAVRINGGETAREAEVVLLAREGDGVVLEATTDATVLLLSGEPIDEPVTAHGPFVMNTQEEINQAFADLRSGRFGEIPAA